MRDLRKLWVAAAIVSFPSAAFVPAVLAEPVWLTDLDQALAEAAAHKKLVFLDYYAAWCPPCQDLDREVLRSGALGPYESEFVFVHLDGDRLPANPAYKKYPLTGYPTVWILSPEGKPLGRYSGYEDAKGFLEFVSETVAGRDWGARLEERLAKEPDNPEVLGEAYSAALIAGEAQKAQDLRKKIRARRDEWGGAYERSLIDECGAALYAEAPDYDGVLRLADAFLEELPKGFFAPSAAHLKAKALRGLGRTPEADALAAALPERFPDSASAYWRLLEYARLNGVLRDRADRALEAGLRKFPDNERFLNQAVLYLKDLDRGRAAGIARKLRGVKPKNAYYDELIRELSQRRKDG